ncbi:MAG: FprA family A-type flavoprotein [Clostridia bacterium]
MDCIPNVNGDLLWVGANDRRLNLFENAFPIARGISYNAYLLLDEKTVLLDTVDKAVGGQLLENMEAGLHGRRLDYIVIHHMEPDHCATLADVLCRYPEATLVMNPKTAAMVEQFFGPDESRHVQIVKEGDKLQTGRHCLTFLMAPMVHWPEVMVSYDETDQVLFSADAFGSFGAISGFLFADEVDFDRDWLDEARRYYANIVGKYGAPVQALLKKLAPFTIATLCPLHGPIWRKDINWFLDKYTHWCTYTPEHEGVLVAYASIYGHTQNAAEVLAMELRAAGVRHISVMDLSVTHVSYAMSEAFRLSRMALCAPTYNGGLFPAMEQFLLDIKAHNLQNRSVALVENGSWAPAAGKLMRGMLEGMKNVTVFDETLSIRSALKPMQREELRTLARRLASGI